MEYNNPNQILADSMAILIGSYIWVPMGDKAIPIMAAIFSIEMLEFHRNKDETYPISQLHEIRRLYVMWTDSSSDNQIYL